NEKKQTRLIGFVNQKGGAGKSTSAMNLATAIWYDLDLNWDVALWDCDNPQFSVSKLRQQDELDIVNLIDLVGNGKMKSFKKYIDDLNEVLDRRATTVAYPIRTVISPESDAKGGSIINSQSSNKVEKTYIKDALYDSIGNYDVVLIDLPGKIDSNETIALLPYLDCLMVPIDFDSKTIDSSLSTLQFLYTVAFNLKTQPSFLKDKRIFIYFAKMKKGITSKKKEYAEQSIIEKFPFVKTFDNAINEAENIKEDPLKTFFPLPTGRSSNTHFNKFYSEFIEKII
ncbi:MAG: ParA family protein, partial [Silvanigrellaceae bacterium]|nr:ParA family protein [Silvanigrellaceae bacterium]